MTLPTPYCTCCGAVTCVIDITGKDDVANWTQDSGTWTNGGLALQTSSANGFARFNTAHPDGLSTGAIQFNVILPTTGAIRVCWAVQDSDNYLFVEYEVMGVNCTAFVDAFVRLGHRTGGGDTILEQVNIAGLASSGTKSACYDGAIISASNLGTAVTATYWTAGHMDGRLSGTWGDQIAFETIGITGTAQFQLLSFYGRNDETCFLCTPACSLCSGGDVEQKSTPSEVSLYLDGVVSAACATCEATFNGVTFILENPYFSATPDADCDGHISRGCLFNVAGLGCAVFGNDEAEYRIRHNSLFTNRLVVIDDGTFNFDVSAAESCKDVLTVGGGNSAGGGFGAQRCYWTGATAEVTPNMA
jgi:hypothetical protein